jgi:hypothetical protein
MTEIRRRDLNPDTEAELTAMMEEALRQVRERDQLANRSAMPRGNADEPCEEEGAKNPAGKRRRRQPKRTSASKP